ARSSPTMYERRWEASSTTPASKRRALTWVALIPASMVTTIASLWGAPAVGRGLMKRMAKKRTIIAAAKGRSTRGSLIVSGMRFFFLAVGRFAPPMEMLIERLLTVGFLRGAGSAT